MRRTTIALALACQPITALCQEPGGEAWRAVFVAEQGPRLDYMTSTRTFDANKDGLSSYRLEFNVPAEGQRATIRLLPAGDNTGPSEDYDAFVLARSADMIALVMVTGGLTRGDEVEMYTLYPKLGVGFSTATSSYLGDPGMRAVAAANPSIPAATSRTFPLRRIDSVSR